MVCTNSSTSLLSVGFNYSDGKVSQDAVLLAPSFTGFYTKPFEYSPVLTISPMIAVSSPFLLHDWFENTTTWNEDVMAIIGSSFNINLTQRFKLNVGFNTYQIYFFRKRFFSPYVFQDHR